MNFQQATELIHAMGFSRGAMMEVTFDGYVTGDPVRRYQEAFAGDGHDWFLRIDGVAGPKTFAALQQWGTRLSRSFEALEFADNRTGENFVKRELVWGCQLVRDRTGKPLTIRSGCRTHETNRVVGGAPSSQHLFGRAADITPAPPQKLVRGLRYFTGLGFAGRGAVVRHVDVRLDVSATDPVTWRY